MKNLCLVFAIVISSATSYCVNSDTTYFDINWKKCAVNEAKYYRIVSNKGNDSYLITDYYLNGTVQMKAESTTFSDPINKEGNCIYFNEDGSKSSEGKYKDNSKTGIWKIWFDGGKDSSIIEYKADGGKSYLRQSKHDVDDTYTIVEVMPTFPGGQEGMVKYLKKNLKYPESAIKDSIQGKVFVQFVVSKTGEIENVKVIRGVRNDIDEAATKVVKEMPKWTPGSQNNRPVNVVFNLPLQFTLPSKK